MTTVGYTTTEELARVLQLSDARATTLTTQLTAVLTAAWGEVDDEIGQHETDAVALTAGWQTALAAEVQLERAVEHWHAQPISFGIIGLDSESPIRISRDTWDRHANKLAPLKTSWGVA